MTKRIGAKQRDEKRRERRDRVEDARPNGEGRMLENTHTTKRGNKPTFSFNWLQNTYIDRIATLTASNHP